MQETLKSILLEFDESFFHIDFIKSSSGENYISVLQTLNKSGNQQRIRINVTDLSEIIATFQTYQTEMFEPNSVICKDYFSNDQQQSIVSIYLKGVTIKDLALQFNCNSQIITQVLLNNHIEIVDQHQPRRNKRER